MLVLTRKTGETLTIETENNEVIRIQITDIRGKQIKIGFEAPQSCKILRQELLEDAVTE